MNIYWDIDGTLINTGDAGNISEYMIRKQYNVMSNKHFYSTKTGVTDRFYMFQLFILCFSRVPSNTELYMFSEEYGECIIRILEEEKNKSLIADSTIFSTPKYKHRIFTGNFRKLAINKIKLFYDINCFDFENSIYGDYTFSKKEALENFIRNREKDSMKDSVFISDSSNDIKVAKDVGAYTIGVLTGSSTYKAMEEIKPNYIWNNVPQFETFFTQVEMLKL